MSLGKSTKNVSKGIPALLIADSFDTYFRPLSFDLPRTLFPVCNLPMLDYTIEFLLSNNITEIYIFCVAHPEKIKYHIKSSKWSKVPGLEIKPLVFPKAQSEGDALREMCKTLIFRDDFILISGDVIANLDLQPAIKAHQERRKKNKECLMTAVYRETPPGHHSRAARDDIMAAIDETTHQILGYESKESSSFLNVHKKLLTHSVVFRNDLLDCRIAVCSLGVLQSFEDNFDYTLISQFICGVVNEEILGAQVHAYVATEKYAARVNCLRTYRAITHDVINRWSFPLVPDNNITDATHVSVAKFLIYKDEKVNIARSANIGTQTLIGTRTTVGPQSRIDRSVIGKDCIIGKNVIMTGCILWDNVIIGDNVTIIDSVVASGAQIRANATVERGSVISFNVIIGESVKLDPFTKLRVEVTNEGLSSALDLGKSGKGWEYTPAGRKRAELGTEFVPQDWEIGAKEEFAENDDPIEELTESPRTKFLKAISISVMNCCEDGYAGEGSVINCKTELMATKLAFDVEFLALAEGVLLALLGIAPTFNSAQFKQNCTVWSSLLKKFVKDSDTPSPGVELIFLLQAYSDDHAQYKKVFPDILAGIWETVVSTEEILEWAEELKSEDDAANTELLATCDAFLSSIQNQSSGSFGDGEEDDDEWWSKTPAKVEREDESSGNNNDESKKSGSDSSFEFDDDSF